MTRRRIITLVATIALIATGCSDGDQSTTPDASDPDTGLGSLPETVADFTYEPAPVRVGQPVTFDASPTEPVDPTLRLDYSWTFDGRSPAHGEQIVHIFSEPGEKTVWLLADNAGWKDTIEKTIDVGPAPPLAPGSAALNVSVVDLDGDPVSGAEVGVIGRDGRTAVDARGFARLEELPHDTRISLVVYADGHSPRYQSVEIPNSVGQATVEIPMRSTEIDRPLDVSERHLVDGRDAWVFAPGKAFVDSSGDPIEAGLVQLQITPLGGPRAEAPAFPGSYDAWMPSGPKPHRFFGGVDIRAFHDGESLRLGEGKELDIVIPATYPAAYEGLPMHIMRLEPQLGYWMQEGTGQTRLTEKTSTRVGVELEVTELGAWAIATPDQQRCDVDVRCVDPNSDVPSSCTVKTVVTGIRDVGSTCEPDALTEGSRCRERNHCVNCDEGTVSSSRSVPSGPCRDLGNGNTDCGSTGGGSTYETRCVIDRSYQCRPDASGLGHCIEQTGSVCGEGLFCDVHARVDNSPTPDQGVCTAMQSRFMADDGLQANTRIIPGAGTVTVPTTRVRFDVLGPEGRLRGSTGNVDLTESCPGDPLTIQLQ
jgi:PKD repeat protein